MDKLQLFEALFGGGTQGAPATTSLAPPATPGAPTPAPGGNSLQNAMLNPFKQKTPGSAAMAGAMRNIFSAPQPTPQPK